MVGIFRGQLFKGSAVFIQQQAEAPQHFEKCYVGRHVIGKKLRARLPVY